MPLLRAREIGDIVEQARVTLAITDARVASDLDAAMAGREGARVVHFGGDSPGLQPGIADRRQIGVVHKRRDSPPTIRPSSRSHRGRPAAARARCTRIAISGGDRYLRALRAEAGRGRHLHRFAADRVHLCAGWPRSVSDAFGASTALIEQASPPLLLEGIQKFRATITITSPTAYRAMLKQAGDFDLTSLRKCVSAGETLPAATFNAGRRRPASG
jgi:2-aminobenzoate-CoA ligase